MSVFCPSTFVILFSNEYVNWFSIAYALRECYFLIFVLVLYLSCNFISVLHRSCIHFFTPWKIIVDPSYMHLDKGIHVFITKGNIYLAALVWEEAQAHLIWIVWLWFCRFCMQLTFLLWLQVHLDHKHMGLGGDDSWTPCVHDKYLIPPVPYAFSVRLCPVTAANSGQLIYKAQQQNWQQQFGFKSSSMCE